MVTLTDHLDMTIVVDRNVKPQNKTKKRTRINLLLFDSRCSAYGFSPIPSERIKPDIQNKNGPLTNHLS